MPPEAAQAPYWIFVPSAVDYSCKTRTGRAGDSDAKVVTERSPTEAELAAMMFGWRVVKHVKSNAIVYADCRSNAWDWRGPDVAGRCIAHRGLEGE